MPVCIITGQAFSDVNENEKHRELCVRFGYNSRFRAVCYVLTQHLCGKPCVLASMPPMKHIRGIGMSDGAWADLCAHKFDYVNTFLHREPQLDICDSSQALSYQNLDFIISSDVFEHIPPRPGLSAAFSNLYGMLRPGGTLIFSVPYSNGSHHREHYPDLCNYRVDMSTRTLHNTTAGGQSQVFRDLVFHGGEGATLEMRVFSKSSVLSFLQSAGFVDIHFHAVTKDMEEHGIFWHSDDSYVISAKTRSAAGLA